MVLIAKEKDTSVVYLALVDDISQIMIYKDCNSIFWKKYTGSFLTKYKTRYLESQGLLSNCPGRSTTRDKNLKTQLINVTAELLSK